MLFRSRVVQNIQPLQPFLLHACANGNLSDGDVDKSCLFDANVGLSADGFVDKYRREFNDNLCNDEPDYSDQLEICEKVCDTDNATANVDAATSLVDNDTILPVDDHDVI